MRIGSRGDVAMVANAQYARRRQRRTHGRRVVGNGSMPIPAFVIGAAIVGDAADEEPDDAGDQWESARVIRQLMVADQIQTLECVVLVTLEMQSCPTAGSPRYGIWKLSVRPLHAPHEGDQARTRLQAALVSGGVRQLAE